jgi:hypothetical protein
MSSKKALRKERQAKEQEESTRRGKPSPAMLFILGIGAVLLVTVGAALLFVERGDAPWPGAVWSEAHGHWH